jgi:hypothetical protein
LTVHRGFFSPIILARAPERFETYQDIRGEWRFRLKDANGQIIATGEGYSSEYDLATGIKAVTKYSLSAEIKVVE